MNKRTRKTIKVWEVRISEFSNAELFQETLDAHCGDSDGCFTDADELWYGMLIEELNIRLEGWLHESK